MIMKYFYVRIGHTYFFGQMPVCIIFPLFFWVVYRYSLNILNANSIMVVCIEGSYSSLEFVFTYFKMSFDEQKLLLLA